MSKHKGVSIPLIIGIIAAILLSLLILPFIFRGDPVVEDPEITPTPENGVVEPGEVSLGEILQNPSNYYNRSVTITSDIEERISPRSFVLNTPENDNQLLVLSSQPIIARGPDNEEINLEDTSPVRVIGVIRQFNREEIENEFAITLDEALDEFENQPVLLLQNIQSTT